MGYSDSSLSEDIHTLLLQNPLCLSVRLIESDSFAPEKFFFKLRAEFIKGCSFQVRIYVNRSHVDYSYQLFREGHLLRWDNKEEHRYLRSFPHHHHLPDNSVVESPLSGNPRQDLRMVLFIVERFLLEQI